MTTITGKYQIRDLKIINPSYEVINVNDNIKDKTCVVEVIFKTDSVVDYSLTFSGFKYSDTWEDVDILAFIDKEVLKLAID